MPIVEVFPNPTVKSVSFEIRFPNLFYMESKVGEFQVRVIERFPESALLFRKQLLFADIGPGGVMPQLPTPPDDVSGQKVWQFKSPQKCLLNLQANSLALMSDYHKTYNLGQGDKFREIIKFVMDAFLDLMRLPAISRIGLRYIDECPIPQKSNESFSTYYNSAFPLERFNIADAIEMDFKTVTKKGDTFVRYVESLQKKPDETYKLVMDFDGFQEKIDSAQYLTVTDKLHDLISAEYEQSIKEPLYQYMRQPVEG